MLTTTVFMQYGLKSKISAHVFKRPFTDEHKPGRVLTLRDEDNSIQEPGWRYLVSWRQKAAQLFTANPEVEKGRAGTISHSIDLTRLQMNMWREKLLGELSFIFGLQG